MTPSISRRSFVAGAGAVGAVGALTAMTAGAATARAADVNTAARRARTVILGGRVFTGTARGGSGLEAVAIGTDGRILEVGRSRDVRRWISRGTVVVDAAGGSIMSGIHDGHMHPLGAAAQSLNPSLQNASVTVPQLQEILAGFINATSDAGPDAWLQVTDWNPVGMLPAGTVANKAQLDAITTTRPIYLQGSDFHNSFVNSRALALAGITRDTPDPAGGEIVKDASGDPTGLLKDNAQGLVGDVIPPPSQDRLDAAYATMATFLLSQGVTSFLDAASGPDSLATYAELQAKGLLLQNVTPAVRLSVEQTLAPRDTVAWLRTLQAAHQDNPRLHVTTTKVFVDGVIEFPAQTAALLTPYLDTDGQPTDNLGDLYITSNQYAQLAIALDAAGWQMHSHAIGDRAVRTALDAYEAAFLAGGGRSKRRGHTIAHLQLVHRDDHSRFARLGTLASMQLQWAVRNVFTLDALEPFIGPSRWGQLYPAQSLARAGATLVGGSDWPVDPFRPFNQIATAIDRLDPVGDTTPLVASEAISREASLRMHTRGSAEQLRSEGTGTVAVGQRADLMVLDRDLTRVSVNDVRGTVVQHTLIAGEVVHDADSSAARQAASRSAAATDSVTAVTRYAGTRRDPHSCCGH